MANRQQAVVDAIGEDKRNDYERYVSSMQERQAVAELQKRLTGDLTLPPIALGHWSPRLRKNAPRRCAK